MKRRALVPTLALLLVACSDKGPVRPPTPTSGRAVGVKAKSVAGKAFCEKSWEPGARRFARPTERPLPPGVKRLEQEGAWTWVNLWATWCVPCIEEMGLLAKWRGALVREGHPFRLELWSIDNPADAAKLAARIEKGLPGPVRWLPEAAMVPFFAHLGVAKGTPIPIHALVDPKGDLRCVRVGAIHGRDYGQVKALLGGG